MKTSNDRHTMDLFGGSIRQAPLLHGQHQAIYEILRASPHGVLNVELKIKYKFTESSARVLELIRMGFNIQRLREPVVFYAGKRWRKAARYVLGVPEWFEG